MKNTIKSLISVAMILCFVGCAGNGTDQQDATPPEEIPATTVNALLLALKDDLSGISEYATNNEMTLDEISLTVSGTTSITDSGSIKILIFKFGASQKEATTAEYTITLADAESTTATSLEEASEGFALAIKKFIDSRPTLANFETTKIVGSLQFVLEDKGSGSASAEFNIVPITLELGRDMSDVYKHTLKLTLTVD